MSLCWITKPPCRLSEGVRRHWLIKYLVYNKLTTTKAVPLQGFISFFSFRGSGEHNGLESQENKVAFVVIPTSLSHFSLSFLCCEVAITIIIALPYSSVIWVRIN